MTLCTLVATVVDPTEALPSSHSGIFLEVLFAASKLNAKAKKVKRSGVSLLNDECEKNEDEGGDYKAEDCRRPVSPSNSTGLEPEKRP